ncbi:hypothetical protein niasHT_010568 [Heterodera trifolii]|uniref:Uncharacterized protein n=1 Tax=Heterodera trifolii TaxID=157864 RepID=A0ABD2L2B9_9BILA
MGSSVSAPFFSAMAVLANFKLCPFFFALAIGIPSALLYCLLLLVIVANSKHFSSPFFILVFIRAILFWHVCPCSKSLDMLDEFCDFNYAIILAGYLLMLLYALLGVDNMFLLLHNYPQVVGNVARNELGFLMRETACPSSPRRSTTFSPSGLAPFCQFRHCAHSVDSYIDHFFLAFLRANQHIWDKGTEKSERERECDRNK